MSRLHNWEHLREALQATAHAYIEHPEDYIRTFNVQINGKMRHIITYQANEKGRALRYLHQNFSNVIRLSYVSAASSYAYKKGSDIHTCLEKHMSSNVFLKTDIHSYFDTINYDRTLEKLLSIKFFQERKKLTALFLSACFYDGKLPIGYVSSPVISDLYLKELDEELQAKDKYIYTRYADDIIISGTDNAEALVEVKELLSNRLSDLGLELNSKKTYIRTLSQAGDVIHLLGLNLVYSEPGKNRITVSDKYIRQTSKEICDFLDNTTEMDAEEKQLYASRVLGRIEFVKHSSLSSYKKLERMVAIKRGAETPLDRKSIIAQ